MKLGVVKAYLKKEFIDLIRSKMIFLVYFMPSLIIFLFGYGLKLEITHARTVLIDRDNTKLSTEIVRAFSNSKYFDSKLLNISDNQALKLIKQNKADLFIIIPHNFQRNLIHSKNSEVGVFIDGSFPLRATTLDGYVNGVFLSVLEKNGIKMPFKVNQRNLFNESMRDENAIIPGVIGLALLIAPSILAALLIVKEKELGTIFNFYSTSIKKSEFLIAKLTPPFVLHSVNIIILFLWAVYWFKVPFKGSFMLYILASELYILVSVGIGLLVSIITKTQVSALVLSVIITVIPGFLYSGIMMPISSMTGESYIEAHIFPVMYYNHIVYDTFLVGRGFESAVNIKYLIILFFYGIGLIAIGSALLKKAIK
ncbi:ABC transporter permease [Nautilia sp. PV-1]|uniref:ABC transporter permease n=1 Tax=Nautilia sp. PV-1 TaxID=2579250 RepID=UPI000FDBF7A3|nr:ABC transporter permease [Nautilia sp. PV-1]AZV47308.1 ABC transporter permease [Nautilia sp. PV-1]